MSTSLEVVRERLPRPLDEIEAALGLPGESFDPRGLKIPDAAEVTIDEWSVYGHTLCFMQEWSRWSVGDWLVWGERVYGDSDASAVVDGDPQDRYNVAARITGLEPGTLMTYASVCARIPIDVRRVELNCRRHRPVMGLNTEEQVHWLGLAVENAWTREQLADAIKESKRQPGDDQEIIDPVPDPKLSIAERVERAARLCFNQAQPTSEGGALVPPDPWHQLTEALGEE